MARAKKPAVFGGWVDVDGATMRATLHIDNPAIYRAALKHYAGRVRVTIEPEEETRRQRANRYYWGVCLKLMAEESGHTADELHELMRMRHNSKVLLVADPTTGEEREVRIPQTTAKLSIADFGVYLERVMVDAAEWLGIAMPEPTKAEDWRQKGTAAA